MTKTRFVTSAWLVLVLLLSACAPRSTPTPQPTLSINMDAMNTQAAMTLEAQPTPQIETPTPNISPVLPEPPSLPTATPQSIPCNRATFIADVTIPDGASVRPGEPMRKTWRLRNDGACVWSGYNLVFTEGTNMGADTVGINATVYPGETVDISIDLAAPNRTGNFTGYYKLRDANGNIFGITARNGQEIAFWVRIRVMLTQVTYDFAADAASARWQDGFGDLPYNNSPAPGRGFALDILSPRMEDKTHTDLRAIQAAPNNTANGYLEGAFPYYTVQAGDHFVAGVGCHADAKQCLLTFQLSYREEGSAPVILRTWAEKNDGLINNVDVDLSSLAGKRVSFILTVNAGSDPTDDLGFWLQPRIMR